MKTYQLIFLSLAIMFLSCEREDQVNPSINDLFGDLSITQGLAASQSTIDIAVGEQITFTAGLSGTVNWQLTIRGQSSGVTKTITGFSDALDAGNATWQGDADHPYFSAEVCDVLLTFPDHPSVSDSITITITAVPDLSLQGTVVSDFESGTGGFTGFDEAGEIVFKGITNTLGGNYFEYTGTDLNANWFIGTSGIPATVEHAGPHYPTGTADPNNLYMNLFVYGSPDNEAQVSIEFQEDDAGDGNPGVYDDADDDTWVYSIYPNWEGWQLVSFKLSDCTRATQAAFGGSGNGIQEVDRILNFQVVLLAQNGVPDPVNLIYDYPIFTVGAPFSY